MCRWKLNYIKFVQLQLKLQNLLKKLQINHLLRTYEGLDLEEFFSSKNNSTKTKQRELKKKAKMHKSVTSSFDEEVCLLVRQRDKLFFFLK